MMDDVESEGYVSFHLDHYKLCQTCLKFTVKMMIFIKNTIFIMFIFITVTSSDKKVFKL